MGNNILPSLPHLQLVRNLNVYRHPTQPNIQAFELFLNPPVDLLVRLHQQIVLFQFPLKIEIEYSVMIFLVYNCCTTVIFGCTKF